MGIVLLQNSVQVVIFFFSLLLSFYHFMNSINFSDNENHLGFYKLMNLLGRVIIDELFSELWPFLKRNGQDSKFNPFYYVYRISLDLQSWWVIIIQKVDNGQHFKFNPFYYIAFCQICN
eukprot:TRINITY_DN31574_c0_g1_i2.p2 TRINITY_DN31574_c0_g1~~TRINITY_DN31574_c0_g1_i2.p2  ORF type:complete len:119 (+),score=3.59 TRINITY_DN31574_c0_g1_i2:88-444(+)